MNLNGVSVETLTNKQMIEHLSKFRDAGDKLSEHIYDISIKIFEVIADLQARQNRSEGEEQTLRKLSDLSELLLSSAVDSGKYNQSMWHDYTKVIKALGSKQGDKTNA